MYLFRTALVAAMFISPNAIGQNAQPLAESVRVDVTFRDFTSTHSDFHTVNQFVSQGLQRDVLRGNTMVLPELDAESRPQLNPDYLSNGNASVESAASFGQWFRGGAQSPSREFPGTLTLEFDAATQKYSLQRNIANGRLYFPVDGRGFADEVLANDGKEHNFWFTSEIVTTFAYSDPASRAGEPLELTFKGDDDVFVYINRRLALSLGGIHREVSETIDVDTLASELGLVGGNTYELRIFHAERLPVASNFFLETNLNLGLSPLVFSYD